MVRALSVGFILGIMLTYVCDASSPEIRALRSELRHLKSKERALRCYDRRSQRKLTKSLRKLSRSERRSGVFGTRKSSSSGNETFQSLHEAQTRYRSSPASIVPDTFASTRCGRLNRKIFSCRLRIAALERASLQRSVSIRRMGRLRQGMKHNLDHTDPASVKSFTSVDREMYQMKRSIALDRGRLLDATGGDVAEWMRMAMSQRQALTQAMALGKGVKGMSATQLNSTVTAAMPQSAPGASPDSKGALNNQMEQSIKRFGKLKRNGADIADAEDTLSFVPDPFRGMPWQSRLTFTPTWQVQPVSRINPLVFDVGVQLGYLWRKDVTPFVGASYRIGAGDSWNEIHFSAQGFSLRSGVEYGIIKQLSLLGMYEHTWLRRRSAAEAFPPFSTSRSLVLGVSTRTRWKLMIGCNILSFSNDSPESPWIFRVGITL